MRIIFVLSLISNFLSFTAEADPLFTGEVPQLLYNKMVEANCKPIEKFYARDVYKPSFIFPNSFNEYSDPAIFTCEELRVTSDSRYKIVVLNNEMVEGRYQYKPINSCKSEILFVEMPGGLSIKKITVNSINDINLWSNTRKYIVKKERALLPLKGSEVDVILESVDGVSYGLFCYGGLWYNFLFD
ncbi:MAG: hypothetical protein Q9M92_01635 [Enterobacterales bacterium]|nr:hypothetical protein [Enterobacterales bacterium]